jgi:glycine cleavage system H protein
MTDQPKTLFYKRAQFVTHLPVDYFYSPSHAWIGREADNEHWRVGLTKFATRMLGEMVDHGFELEAGATVEPGDIIGWVEGFKAISDLYCIGSGTFAGGNAILRDKVTLISKDPYGAGWLYRLKGQPEPTCLDVHAYRAVLDKTIDKILEKQQEGKE